jgi:Sec-independent protein secretion pathway component TatC
MWNGGCCFRWVMKKGSPQIVFFGAERWFDLVFTSLAAFGILYEVK